MKTLFSDSSHLDFASLPLSRETCQGPGDLKWAFVSQSMSPRQSASTDIGNMNLRAKRKTNIGAVFLRRDQRPHDLRESQLPENRESRKGNNERSTLDSLGWFIMLLTFRKSFCDELDFMFTLLCNLQHNKTPLSKPNVFFLE